MGIFRSTGKGIGIIGGGLIGGTVKLTGKVVGTKFSKTGDWLDEVGDGVYNGSKTIMENTGQFADGVARTGYGLAAKDTYHKQAGFDDVKESAGKTFNGIRRTLTYTANGAKQTVTGAVAGDKEKAVEGLKQVGKVAAVSALAFGVLDLVDGNTAEAGEVTELDTRNSMLEGTVHQETGVPFERNIVTLPSGEQVAGVFPVFEYDFVATIPEDLYVQENSVHVSISNAQLYDAIQVNPSLASDLNLSAEEVELIGLGVTPENYVWHHHEEPGRMELMNRDIHEKTGHSGGQHIWGAGSME
ncbi:HNH endonuclease [Alkalihalophilus pseudofirmus]|uniref:HNH endonuclease n=1 Tax=Alkalihalophilus pseudofirmus TaxID=79885 RepID=A0AAJ2NPT9_ALKPS|nr:HNH endonuclease [Alkalihalophilus pseudofirmus]MDV2886273.1 HNH endonuclease [Alkalihalophilus pseudofirmus]